MLVYRLPRWSNIDPALNQLDCLVCAVMADQSQSMGGLQVHHTMGAVIAPAM